MSFLVFAFRKLDLKSRIRRKNNELMAMSRHHLKIQDQIAQLQQAKDSMQNAWGSIFGLMTGSAQNIFSASINAPQSEVSRLTSELSNATSDSQRAALQDQLKIAQDKANSVYNTAFTNYQAAFTGFAGLNQIVNSVFTASEEAQIKALQAEDQQYENRQGSLETELTFLNEEYNNVKKAEQQAAKDAAPSFGQ